ncbi:MAG: DNA replication and repair protein RecF, partial [Ignavibacteria bacterium]|nr:DNA replication and repair protein RecF [Ignavibacteria bacterium]
INPFYMDLLSQYLKVLKERNLYLKGNKFDDAYLDVLTTKLVELQKDIIRFKTGFIDRLNQIISLYYQKLSISTSLIRIHYSGPVEWSEKLKDELMDKYQKSLERDKVFKMTHVGIHRDDFEFYIDESEVLNVASQGQKRLIIVALKCSLIEVIEEMSGDKPILLLDDVFSELDIKRREALFEVLHQNTQTIITTTDLEDVRLWTKDHVSIFEVDQGKVVERSRIDE